MESVFLQVLEASTRQFGLLTTSGANRCGKKRTKGELLPGRKHVHGKGDFNLDLLLAEPFGELGDGRHDGGILALYSGKGESCGPVARIRTAMLVMRRNRLGW